MSEDRKSIYNYRSREMREAAYNTDSGIPIENIIPSEETRAKMLDCAGLQEQAQEIRQSLKREVVTKSFDTSDVKTESTDGQSGRDYVMDGARKYVEVYKYLRGELGLTGMELEDAVRLVLNIDWKGVL